jgi:hypothetical protein
MYVCVAVCEYMCGVMYSIYVRRKMCMCVCIRRNAFIMYILLCIILHSHVCICVFMCMCVCVCVCARARIIGPVSKLYTDHFGLLVRLYTCNEEAFGTNNFINTSNSELCISWLSSFPPLKWHFTISIRLVATLLYALSTKPFTCNSTIDTCRQKCWE